MMQKTAWKKVLFGALALLTIYLSGSALAHRNYWAGLFWGQYLSWLPAYDPVNGPRESVETRMQYSAATDFIRGRLLSPATAKFCSYSDAKFGTAEGTIQKAMTGCVDAQNAFGASMRRYFFVSFEAGTVNQVYSVRWDGPGGELWLNKER